MNTAALKFGKGSDNAKLRKLEEKLGKKVLPSACQQVIPVREHPNA
jgi:hypothetical protein